MLFKVKFSVYIIVLYCFLFPHLPSNQSHPPCENCLKSSNINLQNVRSKFHKYNCLPESLVVSRHLRDFGRPNESIIALLNQYLECKHQHMQAANAQAGVHQSEIPQLQIMAFLNPDCRRNRILDLLHCLEDLSGIPFGLGTRRYTA